MTTDTYLIVEPNNGEFDMGDGPRAYEVGELVPEKRPELAGVAPVLYLLDHGERQLSHIHAMASNDHEQQRAPIVCATLETEAGIDEVREHLAQALLLSKPVAGTAVFRYYDPRVYSHLGWILEPSQLATLMGPVVRWSWLDVSGQWKNARFDGQPSAPLAVRDEQYQQIARLALVRQVLTLLQDGGVDITPELPRQIDAQIRKAEAYGLEAEDQIPFALHGVLVASNFDRHPQIQAVIAGARAKPYAEAVAAFDDNDWQRIGRESADYPLR
ncbi:DUF4123 domain-containing protein [Paraburkholderia sp. ZP32-5]|uniref:DUF4123 domain-containing protein n=1 Tax=Paraburkholderia sp. ZP32-5 TaxID=2883245 RepID=UPI001F16386D|nr:DUF4123 domain-containing protein [Paraburkholderia sp. ZP32-5]